MDAHSTKSAKEKASQKYVLRVPPERQHDWEAAIREANEALNKKPMERKLALIRKHSSDGVSVISNFEHHNDSFELCKLFF